MNDVNPSNTYVESNIIVANKFMLQHSRSIVAHNNEPVFMNIIAGPNDDKTYFGLDIKFLSDPGEKQQISYTVDEEKAIIHIGFTNLCFPYYDEQHDVATDRTEITEIDGKKWYVEVIVEYIKDKKNSKILTVNLYSDK